MQDNFLTQQNAKHSSQYINLLDLSHNLSFTEKSEAPAYTNVKVKETIAQKGSNDQKGI